MPRMAVDQLESQRQGRRPLGQGSAQGLHPGASRQAAAARRQRVPAQHAQVVEQPLRGLVRQRQALHVHHGLGQAGRDQRVAHVVQVRKTHGGHARRSQLPQRVDAEGAEHQEPLGPQHAPPFTHRGDRVDEPVQGEVRPDEVEGGVREGQRMRVGRQHPHAACGLRRADRPAQQAAHAGQRSADGPGVPRQARMRTTRHRGRLVERGDGSVQPPRRQRHGAGAQAASDVEHVLGREPDVVHPLQRSPLDLAQEEVGLFEARGAPIELKS